APTLRKALTTNAGLCRAKSGSTPTTDLRWLLDVKTDPAEQVVLDARFNQVLSAIVPDAKVDGEALRDVLKQNLYLPDSIRVVDRRYVMLAGCRPHDCGSKGFAWIDTKDGKSLVAVNGVVASTTLWPEVIPIAAWEAMQDAIGLPDGAPVTFVGRDGKRTQITSPARP